MSFKDLTPEQRKAMAEKSAATRRAKSLERSQRMIARRLEDADEVRKIVSDLADPTLKADNLRLVREAEARLAGFVKPEIVYGEIPQSEPTEPEPDANDPFSLFLLGVPASTREALSINELRDIYVAHVAKAEAEKKAAAKKAVSELAANAARMDAGLVPMATREEMATARRNAELVRWTCEMPPAGDQGEIADDGLRIDGKLLRHGSVHTLTRAQYDSYREIIYRAAEHELTFKGQSRRQRQWLLGRSMSVNNDGNPV